ncbi:uncharacterized protein [Ptychodera flava]|uniref:uncharacterized protein isoform X2 n=1 Tax=Ptychodera flava TaxID=63121 RepID=UPI00396A7136
MEERNGRGSYGAGGVSLYLVTMALQIASAGGENSSSSLIVEWCGLENPESVTSSSDSLYVEYQGGGLEPFDGQKYGFTIAYSVFTVGKNCPDGWHKLRKSCYKFHYTKPKSWQDAQVMCTYDAANLLTIEDEIEDVFIEDEFADLATGDSCVWIGMEDYSTPSREELWINGLNTSYTAWSYDPYEDYTLHSCMVKCLTDGLWYKRACGSLRSFVCKKNVYGTTKTYPVPIVVMYSNGLEIVAMVTVAIMLFIFVALFVGFMAINIKSCRKLRSKPMAPTQSYTAVNEHSVSMEDDDDDAAETVRTNCTSLQGDQSEDNGCEKSAGHVDGESKTQTEVAYEEAGARPRQKSSQERKSDSCTSSQVSADGEKSPPPSHTSEIELKQLDMLPEANTDVGPLDSDNALLQVPTTDFNSREANCSTSDQSQRPEKKKEVIFVIHE